MNSLNITGLGKNAIEREESWDDFFARMRKPNDFNGYAQSISALEFIDILYDIGTHYDPKTGAVDNLNTHQIESLAIDSYYWGPIPLPKNVSVALPNGE